MCPISPKRVRAFFFITLQTISFQIVGLRWHALGYRLLALLLAYALILQLAPRVAVASPPNSRQQKLKSENSSEWLKPNLIRSGSKGASYNFNSFFTETEVFPTTITDAVVTRHKPTLNSGRIEGSLRVLLGESFTINGNTQLTSDLFLPGTPTITLNGGSNYGGLVNDGGAATPANYTLTLNGSVNLAGNIHRQADPIPLPSDFPTSIPTPSGTRTVSVTSQSGVANIGNWQTLRDLNVTGSNITINVPPGNYGTFTVNGNSRLNLTAGTYNFSNTFTLNGSATLQTTGLVTINVGQDLTVTSGAIVPGSYTSPGDVRLNVLGSTVNVNGSSQVTGLLRAYNATATINGSAQVRGQVIANAVVLNSNSKVIGAVWPAQAASCPTIFGPRRFDRTTGPPNQYVEQFSLPASVPSPFTLHIKNGEPDGTHRVSSATVKLNGVDIVSPSDLNQNVAGLDRTVTLTTNNQLDVRLTSSPGSYLTINICGTVSVSDNTAPTIAITSPGDNSTTLDSQITVSGSATDSGAGATGVAHVFVNNVEAAYNSSAGTWTISNVALALGSNQIAARAVDPAGNQSTTTITVRRQEPTNNAPTANAGSDQTLTLPQTAFLHGAATDDGLPSGSTLTTTWSKVTGPGAVTFANANALDTTATFSVSGSYVLSLTSSDGSLSATDDLTVTMQPQNQPPTVSAGPDQTVALPHTVTLDGTVTDDALPALSSITTDWTQVSGPGAVTFEDATLADTVAAFSQAGTYVLRLTASDGELSAGNDVTITVHPENHAPTVTAGQDQTVSQPNAAAQLSGAATDDGQPFGSSLIVSWSIVTGPGGVVFDNPNNATTIAHFGSAGAYVLRLTATDGELAATADLRVAVTPPNQAPTVRAGTDQTIALPNAANLNGTIGDDGLPLGSSVSTLWSMVSGPATVTFANPNMTVTTAAFSQPGIYVLRLTASDSQLSSSDDVTVTVSSNVNHGPQVNAGPDQSVSLPNKNVGFFLNDLNAFNNAAGTPPIVVDFDQIAADTDITGTILSGITFNLPGAPGSSAPLVVTRASDTFTPAGFSGVIDATTNKLPAASGLNVLSPGGPQLGPGFNLLVENDDLKITFQQPVSAVGFDILFQELDFFSAVKITFYDVNGTVLYEDPNIPNGSANGGGAPGGSIFVGFISTRANIAAIVIDEYDNNSEFPDANIGFDSFRVQSLIPSTAIVNLSGVVTDDGRPAGAQLSSSWTMLSGPGSVTFDNPAQANTKASFSDPGVYNLRLTGDDSELNASDYVTITVNEGAVNYPPVVSAGADQIITLPMNSVDLAGTVTDDGQPVGSTVNIFWSALSGPAPVTFGNAHSPATMATFSAVGTYVLRLTANDSQLNSTDEVVITVSSGALSNQPPTTNAGSDQTTVLSAGVQLNGSVSDDGLPVGSNLITTWSKVSGPGTVTFMNPNVTVTGATFSATGTYVLRLTASDSALSASDDITIVVNDDVPAPTVQITAPADEASVTEPTIVTGSVSGGVWTLEYSLGSDDNPNNRFWTQIASGNGLTSGTLGTLDPTMMLNGLFDIRLSATDQFGQTSRTKVSVIVERNLKIGNFTVSFTDLSIPVAGLPMEVTRTYDSRDKRVGDFGFGWTLGLRNIRVEKSNVLGLKWFESVSQEFLPNYCLDPVGSHAVTVTFPGGKVFKFKAGVTPHCQRSAPITSANISFTPMPGTVGKLEVVGSSEVQIDGSVPGPVNLIGFGGGVDIFNSFVFKFTAQDGTAYIIDQRTGLQSLADTSGNTLTINPSGILHSSGKSIVFHRDIAGRIERIDDPNGNSMYYEYDPNGDLISYTDNENNTSIYTYDANHRLLTIQDPRGIQPIRNDYDADGRLINNTDGFGKVITYIHNLAARVETVTDRLGHPTVFEYDERGNVLRKTDARGGVTTSVYDSNDNVLSETNALGKTTSYTYNSDNHRTSITDPLNNVSRFTFNTLGKVLTTTDALGRVTTNTYNAAGNIATTEDALHHITTYSYSILDGQIILMTDSLNNSTRYEYHLGYRSKEIDPLGRVTTFTNDPNGNRLSQTVQRTNAAGQLEAITTNFEYDKMNRLKKTIFADGSFTQIEYNSIGQRSATIDQLGRRTEFAYDDMGRLLKTTYPDGTHEDLTYDAEGHKLTSSERGGQVTTYTYDELGRLTKTTFADGSFGTTVYDAIGRVSSLTDERGNTTLYEYDPNCSCSERRSKITDVLGHVTTFVYDAVGNQLSMTDSRGNPTSYEYDANNRRVKTSYADNSFATMGYDSLGRSISKTDQAGKTTQFAYEFPARLIKVTDDLGQETRYAYDELGNQISQTDALNHNSRYEYDQLGRRTKRILPGGQAETFSYFANGQLQSRVDFNGNTTTYAYDVMDRLLAKTPDASLNQTGVVFTYNARGQRLSMTNASGTSVYTYDGRARLISKQAPQGTLTYTYDGADNLLTTRSSNANGVSVDYGYDALNRLATVKDNSLPAGANTTSYTYDDVGNMQSYTYPNGLKTAQTYNSLNRLTSQTISAGSTNLAGHSYTLGAAGNRLSVTEQSGRVVNYTYDSLYRLTGETISGSGIPAANGSIVYGYDAVGNRLTRSSNLSVVPSTTNSYDSNDRVTNDS